MPVLTPKFIKLHLKDISGWKSRRSAIVRTYIFKRFIHSLDFVNRIAKQAQRSNHHPDIRISFNKVTLSLSTHDEGGVTEKDFAMAAALDKIFAFYYTT